MLAGCTRGQNGSKGGGGRVRLSNVDARRLTGLKLICVSNWRRTWSGCIQEFVNDTDGPAFLERELMALGVGGYP